MALIKKMLKRLQRFREARRFEHNRFKRGRGEDFHHE